MRWVQQCSYVTLANCQTFMGFPVHYFNRSQLLYEDSFKLEQLQLFNPPSQAPFLTNFFILMQHNTPPCLYKFWKISKSDFVSIFFCISCADIMTFKSCCWGYYQICPPTTHAQLPGEYRREAAKVDQELGFMNGDGPTLRKLQRYPPVIDFCFGAYGECSDGVKS